MGSELTDAVGPLRQTAGMATLFLMIAGVAVTLAMVCVLADICCASFDKKKKKK